MKQYYVSVLHHLPLTELSPVLHTLPSFFGFLEDVVTELYQKITASLSILNLPLYAWIIAF